MVFSVKCFSFIRWYGVIFSHLVFHLFGPLDSVYSISSFFSLKSFCILRIFNHLSVNEILDPNFQIPYKTKERHIYSGPGNHQRLDFLGAIKTVTKFHASQIHFIVHFNELMQKVLHK